MFLLLLHVNKLHKKKFFQKKLKLIPCFFFSKHNERKKMFLSVKCWRIKELFYAFLCWKRGKLCNWGKFINDERFSTIVSWVLSNNFESLWSNLLKNLRKWFKNKGRNLRNDPQFNKNFNLTNELPDNLIFHFYVHRLQQQPKNTYIIAGFQKNSWCTN